MLLSAATLVFYVLILILLLVLVLFLHLGLLLIHVLVLFPVFLLVRIVITWVRRYFGSSSKYIPIPIEYCLRDRYDGNGVVAARTCVAVDSRRYEGSAVSLPLCTDKAVSDGLCPWSLRYRRGIRAPHRGGIQLV